MNKTIYVRDSAVWDNAAKLAAKLDRSMSDVIMEMLGGWTCKPLTLNSLTVADKASPRNLFVESEGGHSVEYRWTGWKESCQTIDVAGQWWAVVDKHDPEMRWCAYANAGDPPVSGLIKRGETFCIDGCPTPDWPITEEMIERFQRLRAGALDKLRELVKKELERS